MMGDGSCRAPVIKYVFEESVEEPLILNGQTSRVWDVGSGDTKSELRGHEHVVECAVFAPVAAYPAVRELAGLAVCLRNVCRMRSDPPKDHWTRCKIKGARLVCRHWLA